MSKKRPHASGNFFKDLSRLLGFIWKKHKTRKKSNKQSKFIQKMKREFYK